MRNFPILDWTPPVRSGQKCIFLKLDKFFCIEKRVFSPIKIPKKFSKKWKTCLWASKFLCSQMADLTTKRTMRVATHIILAATCAILALTCGFVSLVCVNGLKGGLEEPKGWGTPSLYMKKIQCLNLICSLMYNSLTIGYVQITESSKY